MSIIEINQVTPNSLHGKLITYFEHIVNYFNFTENQLNDESLKKACGTV